jgi:hypothetical protein
MVKLFLEFQKYIESEKYFESHEILEPLWLDMKKSNHKDKNIIRGFINAAVSMELTKRGREEASKKVWRTYEKYKKDIFHNELYLDMMNFLDSKKPF